MLGRRSWKGYCGSSPGSPANTHRLFIGIRTILHCPAQREGGGCRFVPPLSRGARGRFKLLQLQSVKATAMNKPTIRVITSRREPVFANSARIAAKELSPSIERLRKDVRGIETWFKTNGDPFSALSNPTSFSQDLANTEQTIEELLAKQPNTVVIALLSQAAHELSARLNNASRLFDNEGRTSAV